MKWLRRLLVLPMMAKLHFDHSLLVLDLENATEGLMQAFEDELPRYMVERRAKLVEIRAEQLSDLDERMAKLWG